MLKAAGKRQADIDAVQMPDGQRKASRGSENGGETVEAGETGEGKDGGVEDTPKFLLRMLLEDKKSDNEDIRQSEKYVRRSTHKKTLACSKGFPFVPNWLLRTHCKNKWHRQRWKTYGVRTVELVVIV